ncbi:MAG: hypothetical protein LBV47_05040 [Bacteroidales bacterium]|jgi:hypothetical protein|nr:hypothetical protein [Bacteroidales bacterium]
MLNRLFCLVFIFGNLTGAVNAQDYYVTYNLKDDYHLHRIYIKNDTLAIAFKGMGLFPSYNHKLLFTQINDTLLKTAAFDTGLSGIGITNPVIEAFSKIISDNELCLLTNNRIYVREDFINSKIGKSNYS